ncbi:Protocadherin Fat 4 [Desmophyllum pertusum]|uniref:Protocadherin Fat 4 n=1 Tax=Desmophyllum pertusum TaxID=174260 RepID=A0A9W9ZM08_9CNID|nr:Protocadherin Fat 4 [Desmophyllum pertusum]
MRESNSGNITTAFELDREIFSTSVFVLSVYAVDLSGPSSRTSSATVNISLVDKNDNDPIFLSSVYRSSVKENLSHGASVTTVSAVDKDEGSNARLEYSIVSGNDGDAFQINATTGKITTLKVLTQKSQAKYKLNVTATDSGSPVRHSSAVVMVTVIDANNNAPQFSHSFYSFDVLEETAVGTVLGTLTASDNDIGPNARISYSISGSHQDVFSVDPMSGNLKVAKWLDREAVEIYILNVSASDHGNPTMATHAEVYVNVLDKNDNPPQFKPSVYSESVSEATGMHSSIVTVSATDKDFGSNALLTYTILSGNNDRTFAIYPNGTIYNMKEFDRETKSSYFLTVMARDQAVPVSAQLSSTVTVTVTITDINDNSPYFISSNITHISEHATTGDIVTTVMVADLDAGSNSKITFSLVKIDALAPFSLGASDGVLRVSGNLDREVRGRYVVKVIATDQGVPPNRAELKMTIVVDDYNDHAPAFQSGPSEVRVYENISIGSEVTSLSATDSDQGSNAEVCYSIVAGNENDTFEMNSRNGMLSTIRSLDRETTPNYTLVIRASDLGVPSQSTDKVLQIVLRDINDNTPTFSKASYTKQVPENKLPANVISVKAVDNDEGKDGSVTYDIIHGNDGGVFTINSQTGQIGLRIALDREKQAEYTLTVQAKDGGTPPHVGETEVIVKVLDENDNAPVFQPARLKASVKENAAIDMSVLQVTATDADAGLYGKITYSLAMTFDLFKIDSNTGKITTTAALNRETTPLYKLEVLAKDNNNNNGQTGKAELVVTVEDVNDFDPVFGSNQFTATVAPGAPPGSFVIMVSAADADIGPNAESEYTITSGSSAVFNIAPRTGVITVAQSVPQSPLLYSFTVKAANVNAPQRSDTTSVQINVASGSFPVFQHQDQSITVSELAPVGTKLVTVNATGHTAYFIAAGNIGDVFELDKVLGELKIKTGLDYEEQENYTVVIGAKDGSSQPLSGFVTIHVAVTDENDNRPVLNQSIYQANIQEELPVNTTVLWVSASDADSAANAEMEYKLVPGNSQASSAFAVSAKTGRISTKIQLDRENISAYTFKVRVEDVANRSMASEAVVVVSVQDVNDNAPVFEEPLTASVYENVSAGSLVAVLAARDADIQIGIPLQFGFAAGGNPDAAFTLDRDNGRLTLFKTLNREEISEYTLQVTVNDLQHKTTSNFTVVVLDVNDSPPRFLSNPLTHKIHEKMPIGSAAMNVTAVDDDVGTNAEILYSILPSSPPSNIFTIDRQTGVLRLNKVLVYKKPSAAGNENFYNVTVRAKNSYSPFDEETVLVVVEVIDINDHAPIFTSSSYDFFVIDSAVSGETVGRVEAVDDQDDGVNARVRYQAVSGNGTSLFNIDSDSGNITVASLPDDLLGVFYLRVMARDSGQPAKESFASLYVEVVEANKFSPTFRHGQILVRAILETVAVGDVVETVTASDADSGTNEFVLKVVATDGGRIPRSDKETVRISLSDVNDNRPVFTLQEYDGYVPENAGPGTQIITVTALDPDQGDGGRVEYSISNAGLLGSFEINRSSGEIISKVTFDYEVQRSYELTILAKDQATPPLESQPMATVLVHVTSVNEYTPKFNKSLFQASVAENAPVGQSVTQIYATDQDKGPDGEIVYLLVGESNSLGFSLDRSTGVLSVSGRLDSEQAGIETLQVLVKNALQTSVTPDTSDLATIIVTVTDANDAPRFLKSVYYARAKEEANHGQFVTTVTAVDDDFANQPGAPGARIQYGILAGNTGNAFAIDKTTGTITTAKKLDRETIPQYLLTVTATDQGLPPLSGNATVIVNLDDVNDNAPRLLVNCTGMVKENEPAGTTVVTLQPQDRDVDPNQGPYMFTITGTNYSKFQLNSGTGVLTTTAMLDREKISSYSLSVRISDGGSPQLSAISHCQILVQDVNDNAPLSTERKVHVNSLNSFASGPVANVQPNDPDVDDKLTCQILQDNDGLFNFSPRSCNLNTNKIAMKAVN